MNMKRVGAAALAVLLCAAFFLAFPAQADSGNPNTGDQFPIGVWIAVLAVSGLGIIGLIVFLVVKKSSFKGSHVQKKDQQEQ